MGRRFTNIDKIPYEYITEKKWNSLGRVMPLKKALDMWWNSVRIKGFNILCYKCTDYSYDFIRGSEWLDEDEIKHLLKTQVQLDDCYKQDEDGYPIVYAKLV